MRKCALVLAIVMIAAAPTAAFAAKKKAAAPAAPADLNAPAKKFVTEGFMQPVYAWQSATGQKKK
ncbi:MAG TPA: hypothetical protein VJL90_03445 [Pseudorhodoplanes sp.]|nr:hypothetical protein [Pseudorhodoplanes sp.]